MKHRFKFYVPVLLVISFFIIQVNYAAGNTGYPILVLATDENYGIYTSEILRTEGFNEFEMQPLSDNKSNIELFKEI